MVFTPDAPFPKTRGHVIKSKDWNDAITELQRLDSAKVNRAGDNVTGSLTIAGNAGVGTTTPENAEGWSRVLDILGGAHAKLSVRASSIDARMMAHGGVWGAPAGMVVGTNTNHSLSFGTNKTTRMTIDTAGNVGIGTTSPQRPLQVGGDIGGVGVGPSDASPNAGYVRWGDNTGWKLHFGRSRESSGGALNTGTSGVLMTMQDNGNVGIGTLEPNHKFHVLAPNAVGLFESTGGEAFLRLSTNEGLDNRVEITNRPGGRLSLWTAGFGDAFNILRDGRVGVGTTSPGARLEVNGDIAISGKHALRGNDPWLRLNQDGAFTSGVHTPGVFAPGSLNVGGYNGWGDPGAGNVWITGTVTIAGNLGTAGFPPTAHTPGWRGGIRTFDLEVEATAWVRNGVQTGNRDLAENFSSDMDLDAGDVVCMGYEEDSIVLSEEPDDELVLGVVSSKPGLLLNSARDVEGDTLFPVALCGRVPCKVVDENGPIKRGDLLTSSSTPGHAMKAGSVTAEGGETHRPGTIIGKALGSLESGTGAIEVFVISQ